MYTTGSDCWAPHASKAFVEVVVQETLGSGRVVVSSCRSPDGGQATFWECDEKDLLLRPQVRSCVANMDELPELNMAEVLANVEELYCRRQPSQPGSGWSSVYSSVGPVLIAMNPFTPLPLYGMEWVEAFRQSGSAGDIDLSWKTLGPHCYWTAEQAFQGLLQRPHQTVVICGESGAGKTVTNRMMLEYLLDAEDFCGESSGPPVRRVKSNYSASSMSSDGLAALAVGPTKATSHLSPRALVKKTTCGRSTSKNDMTRAETRADAKRRIAQANALLENFGNAKTVRNDNSSRFGKYSQLQFEGDAFLVRAFEIEHYLLERSRVVVQPQGERNFHVFHQLFKSDHYVNKYSLEGGPESYAYTVTGANLCKTDGANFDDRVDFEEVVKSLELTGFSEEECFGIFEMVAAVLHLGNVDFEGSVDQSSMAPKSKHSLMQACRCLGIAPEGLEKAFTSVRTSAFVRHVGVATALAQRDAVAKIIYSRLFDWLISRLNEKLMWWRGSHRTTIGLLDIFGFEDMPLNGLEQMFINLTNERIQLLFNQIMFERELEAYKRDGVNSVFDAGPSNMPCIELFSSPQGIVKLLADQCKAPGDEDKKDKAFVNILNKHFKNGSHFTQAEPQHMKDVIEAKRAKWGNKTVHVMYSECFFIRHFAGNVLYTVRDFVVKSKDTLPAHLAQVLQDSSKKVMGAVFKDFVTRASTTTTTIGENFVKQLQVLTTKLENGASLFVRCIKPNALSLPGVVNRPFVLEQLVNGGVVAALEMRRIGYPDRMEFMEFCDEFWILEVGWQAVRSAESRADPRRHAEDLLHNFLGKAHLYAFGHTKVFMRSGVLAQLRATVTLRTRRFAIVVQRRWRVKKGTELVHSIVEFQSRIDDLQSAVQAEGFEKVLQIQQEISRTTRLLAEVLEDLRKHGLLEVVAEDDDLLAIARILNPDLSKHLLMKHSKHAANLRKFLVSVSETIEQARTRKARAEQHLVVAVQTLTQETSDLLKRIAGFEEECGAGLGELTSSFGSGLDERPSEVVPADESAVAACLEVCLLARSKIEHILRENLPGFLSKGPVGWESDVDYNHGDTIPGATELVAEARRIVEQAEREIENVKADRRKFEVAVADLRCSRKQAQDALDALQNRAQAAADALTPSGSADCSVYSEALNSLETAWHSDAQASEVARVARDVDGYAVAVREFLSAVQQAEHFVKELDDTGQRHRNEAKNKHREQLRQDGKQARSLLRHIPSRGHRLQATSSDFHVALSDALQELGDTEEGDISPGRRLLRERFTHLEELMLATGLGCSDRSDFPPVPSTTSQPSAPGNICSTNRSGNNARQPLLRADVANDSEISVDQIRPRLQVATLPARLCRQCVGACSIQ